MKVTIVKMANCRKNNEVTNSYQLTELTASPSPLCENVHYTYLAANVRGSKAMVNPWQFGYMWREEETTWDHYVLSREQCGSHKTFGPNWMICDGHSSYNKELLGIAIHKQLKLVSCTPLQNRIVQRLFFS